MVSISLEPLSSLDCSSLQDKTLNIFYQSFIAFIPRLLPFKRKRERVGGQLQGKYCRFVLSMFVDRTFLDLYPSYKRDVLEYPRI